MGSLHPTMGFCADNPCRNGGRCIDNSHAGYFSCVCTGQFLGVSFPFLFVFLLASVSPCIPLDRTPLGDSYAIKTPLREREEIVRSQHTTLCFLSVPFFCPFPMNQVSCVNTRRARNAVRGPVPAARAASSVKANQCTTANRSSASVRPI